MLLNGIRPKFVHFVTFITKHKPENGLNGFYFQAVLRSDFDLNDCLLKCKNFKDMENMSQKYISKHLQDIIEFLPNGCKDQQPERIMMFQQFRY